MANPGFRTSGGGGPGASGAGKAPPEAQGTGLRAPFTQAQIMHLMRTEFARARRYKLPLSCLMVRVDRLDGLTDVHGSEFKANVLRELGRLLAERVRSADQIGALPESTFLVLLPHTSAEQACTVAERLRVALTELLVEVGGARVPLTLSVGVAAVGDHDTLFFDTLLSQAEVALDWATDAGGDRFSLFERDRFVKTDQPPEQK